METQISLDAKALSDFHSHVLSEYPKEACGVLVNGNYYPCKNVATSPTEHFKVSPIDYFNAQKEGSVEAILHSHPFNRLEVQPYPAYYPSGPDMLEWMKSSTPWGIVATEGETVTDVVWLNESFIAPLVGRQFIHGIHDCYSLCRDYYRLEHGITLPNYPRDMRWWKKGLDLYTANFKEAGFEEVPFDEARFSDAFLIQYGSRVINHAAIYVGENEILDHIANRLSGRSTLSGMAPYIKKVVRHKDLK